jgi:hypothetical protein
MPKSVRWYLASLGLTAASLACAMIGDRIAFGERSAKTWNEALAENTAKVADGASAVSH